MKMIRTGDCICRKVVCLVRKIRLDILELAETKLLLYLLQMFNVCYFILAETMYLKKSLNKVSSNELSLEYFLRSADSFGKLLEL